MICCGQVLAALDESAIRWYLLEQRVALLRRREQHLRQQFYLQVTKGFTPAHAPMTTCGILNRILVPRTADKV